MTYRILTKITPLQDMAYQLTAIKNGCHKNCKTIGYAL